MNELFLAREAEEEAEVLFTHLTKIDSVFEITRVCFLPKNEEEDNK